MSSIEYDFSEFKVFFESLGKAAKGDFKRDLENFLEGLGNEFLRILEDEIIRRRVMDSRLLLNSFHKGHENSVWEISDDGLTLEVGTNLEYAQYVNDGHWMNPKGVSVRFVPGYWQGHRFIYDPNAETGMVLKQHWVEGKYYWDSALRILNQIYPEILERKLSQWVDQYFGGGS